MPLYTGKRDWLDHCYCVTFLSQFRDSPNREFRTQNIKRTCLVIRALTFTFTSNLYCDLKNKRSYQPTNCFIYSGPKSRKRDHVR